MEDDPTKSAATPCTQEVKKCADGKYVGRDGPNCEFTECDPPAGTTPGVVPCTLDVKKCPMSGVQVGRVPPNCNFAACPKPTTKPVDPTKPAGPNTPSTLPATVKPGTAATLPMPITTQKPASLPAETGGASRSAGGDTKSAWTSPLPPLRVNYIKSYTTQCPGDGGQDFNPGGGGQDGFNPGTGGGGQDGFNPGTNGNGGQDFNPGNGGGDGFNPGTGGTYPVDSKAACFAAATQFGFTMQGADGPEHGGCCYFRTDSNDVYYYGSSSLCMKEESRSDRRRMCYEMQMLDYHRSQTASRCDAGYQPITTSVDCNLAASVIGSTLGGSEGSDQTAGCCYYRTDQTDVYYYGDHSRCAKEQQMETTRDKMCYGYVSFSAGGGVSGRSASGVGAPKSGSSFDMPLPPLKVYYVKSYTTACAAGDLPVSSHQTCDAAAKQYGFHLQGAEGAEHGGCCFYRTPDKDVYYFGDQQRCQSEMGRDDRRRMCYELQVLDYHMSVSASRCDGGYNPITTKIDCQLAASVVGKHLQGAEGPTTAGCCFYRVPDDDVYYFGDHNRCNSEMNRNDRKKMCYAYKDMDHHDDCEGMQCEPCPPGYEEVDVGGCCPVCHALITPTPPPISPPGPGGCRTIAGSAGGWTSTAQHNTPCMFPFTYNGRTYKSCAGVGDYPKYPNGWCSTGMNGHTAPWGWCNSQCGRPNPNMCAQDTKTCPDGSVLSRDPQNNCNFPPCPSHHWWTCYNGWEQIYSQYKCDGFYDCSDGSDEWVSFAGCTGQHGGGGGGHGGGGHGQGGHMGRRRAGEEASFHIANRKTEAGLERLHTIEDKANKGVMPDDGANKTVPILIAVGVGGLIVGLAVAILPRKVSSCRRHGDAIESAANRKVDAEEVEEVELSGIPKGVTA